MKNNKNNMVLLSFFAVLLLVTSIAVSSFPVFASEVDSDAHANSTFVASSEFTQPEESSTGSNEIISNLESESTFAASVSSTHGQDILEPHSLPPSSTLMNSSSLMADVGNISSETTIEKDSQEPINTSILPASALIEPTQDIPKPVGSLLYNLSASHVNIFPGDPFTWTYTITNPSSSFTARVETIEGNLSPISATVTFKDVSISKSNAIRIDNNSTDTLLSGGDNVFGFSSFTVLPNETVTIVISCVASPTQEEMEEGAPFVLRTSKSFFQYPFSSSVNLTSPSTLIYHPGDLVTLKATLTNHNLDQINNWTLTGDTPSGLSLKGIYEDHVGGNQLNGSGANISVSIPFVNGSNVYDAAGNKNNSPITKDVYIVFEVKEHSGPADIDFTLLSFASSSHDQYNPNTREESLRYSLHIEPSPKTHYVVTFMTLPGNVFKTESVAENDLIPRVSNPTRNGYTFSGWYLENTFWDFDSMKMPARNITLLARWIPITSSSSIITSSSNPTTPDSSSSSPPSNSSPTVSSSSRITTSSSTRTTASSSSRSAISSSSSSTSSSSSKSTVSSSSSSTTSSSSSSIVSVDESTSNSATSKNQTDSQKRDTTREQLIESGVPTLKFGDIAIPLFGGGQTFVWSLVSLLLMLAGILTAAITGIKMLIHRRNNQEYFDVKSKMLKLICIFTGVLSFILFFVIYNLNSLMVFIDTKTALFAVLFIVEFIVLFFSNKNRDAEEV